jgi:hypothetical protein
VYAIFRAPSALKIICANFWDFTLHRMVVPHRRFGITCSPHFQESRSTVLGLLVPCPERSVRNFHSTLRKFPKKGADLMKCKIIPVVIGALNTINKVLKKTLEAISDKLSIDSLQKN